MEAKELSHRIYDIVVHEVDAMYPQFIKRVNDIDIDYFEDITRDSEEMPEELNFELRDIVLDDIRLYAVQLLDRSGIKERIGEVLGGVGPIERKEILEQAKKDLRSYVYASSVLNGSSDISEEKLQKLYTGANKRNLWERVTQSNKSDVIEFHHALMNKTYEQCKDILYECIDSFLYKIQEQ